MNNRAILFSGCVCQCKIINCGLIILLKHLCNSCMEPGFVVDNTEPMIFPKGRESSADHDQYVIVHGLYFFWKWSVCTGKTP